MLKTNAMRLLDRAGVAYEAHEYQVDENDLSGVHTANLLGLEPERLFKTLVAKGEKGGYGVFCLPCAKELDLKKAAKALGEKKVEMLHVKDLKAVTGYIRGGCSPIGMKKAYPVFLDESCAKLPRICISAGVRGCMLELDPAALCAALGFGRLPLTKDGGQAEKEPMQAYER